MAGLASDCFGQYLPGTFTVNQVGSFSLQVLRGQGQTGVRTLPARTGMVPGQADNK